MCYFFSKTLFYEYSGRDPVEPRAANTKAKAAEPEDDEPEADPPMTEEDEMEQEFMSDAHDDYPEGFMDRE